MEHKVQLSQVVGLCKWNASPPVLNRDHPDTVNMAVTPVRYKIPYTGWSPLTWDIPRLCHGLFMRDHGSLVDGSRSFCSASVDISGGWSLQNEKMLGASFLQRDYGAERHLKRLLGHATHRKSVHITCHASRDSSESQLRALDLYFGKLGAIDKPNSGDCTSSSPQDEITAKANLREAPFPLKEDSKMVYWRKLRQIRDVNGQNSRVLENFDDTSELYLISIIASINIAVFLFEIASPVRNSDMDLFSLPLLYGAKINHLILTGEWWRLVTPMFLHSGVLHMALGCWALLTFGPKVCKGYGSFTFFLIYLLGGISGNLTSFLHTPDPTVGGTGPIFAMIGAWLIYQIQNKDMISKEISETMLQKAILATAFSFLLSSFGPIDDWTHLGAAVTGIVYGYFTCPTLRVDDASSTSGQEEGITLVRQPADSCKSLLVFALLTLVLGSLVFFIEPPLGALVADNYV